MDKTQRCGASYWQPLARCSQVTAVCHGWLTSLMYLAKCTVYGNSLNGITLHHWSTPYCLPVPYSVLRGWSFSMSAISGIRMTTFYPPFAKITFLSSLFFFPAGKPGRGEDILGKVSFFMPWALFGIYSSTQKIILTYTFIWRIIQTITYQEHRFKVN